MYTEEPAARNVTAGMLGPDGFGMGADAWLDRSWHQLVDGALTIDLAKLPAQPQVLIRALDIAGAGPRSRALLAAFSAGKGTVLLTGLNILQSFASQTATDYNPAKAWLLFQLVRLASTGTVQPSQQLPLELQATCDCWFGVCTAPANCSVRSDAVGDELRSPLQSRKAEASDDSVMEDELYKKTTSALIRAIEEESSMHAKATRTDAMLRALVKDVLELK